MGSNALVACQQGKPTVGDDPYIGTRIEWYRCNSRYVGSFFENKGTQPPRIVPKMIETCTLMVYQITNAQRICLTIRFEDSS